MTSEIKQRIVYQLVRSDKPDDGTDIYVGSTSLSLKLRLQLHRKDAKTSTSKLYIRMQEVGIHNWEIVPLLAYPCDQKTIREFEKNWVETLNPDLNTFSPLANNYETRCRQADRKLHYNNIRNKRYYCDVCDKSFGNNKDLKRHLRSLRHSNNYMNSVD